MSSLCQKCKEECPDRDQKKLFDDCFDNADAFDITGCSRYDKAYKKDTMKRKIEPSIEL